MQFIYISGPLTQGDRAENLANAIEAAETLRKLGFTPFIPHAMTHEWQNRRQHDEDYWLSFDLEWLVKCDAVIRLPGFSPGGDVETAFADAHGIPVFHDINALAGRTVSAQPETPVIEG